MKPEISVIIPAYNVAPYIRRSLDSVLAQTYQNIEIIVVDDASTDTTAQIVEEYCRKYDNIIFICQPCNQGMGEARNLGNEHAQGTYIFYLDSDDWIEPQTLQTLYEIALMRNADIVACGAKIAYDDGSSEFYHGHSFECSGGAEALSLLAEYKIGTIVWNKLYKKSLIQEVNIKFLPIYHEDVIFSMEIAFHCKSYIAIPDTLCNYFQHRRSITHKKITKVNFIGYFEIMKFITSFFERYQLDSTAEGIELKERLYYSQMQWMIPNILNFMKENKKIIEDKPFEAVLKKYFGAGFYFIEGLMDYFQWYLYRTQNGELKETAMSPKSFVDVVKRLLKSPKLLIKFLLPYGVVKYLERRRG